MSGFWVSGHAVSVCPVENQDAAPHGSRSTGVGADEDAFTTIGPDPARETEHDPQVEALVRRADLETVPLVERDQLWPVGRDLAVDVEVPVGEVDLRGSTEQRGTDTTAPRRFLDSQGIDLGRILASATAPLSASLPASRWSAPDRSDRATNCWLTCAGGNATTVPTIPRSRCSATSTTPAAA